MRYIALSIALAALLAHPVASQAGPFGLLGRRGGSGGNPAGGPAVTPAGWNSSAQGVANHMARILRIGHWGGNSGFEGVGCGATPYQAEMNCCYRQRMQPREVGLAQGANGMWFACCRY